VPREFSEIREQLAQVVSRIQETSDQESRLELLKEMLVLLREVDQTLNMTDTTEK